MSLQLKPLVSTRKRSPIINPATVDITSWRYQDYLNAVFEMDIKEKSAKLYQSGIAIYLDWLNGKPVYEATTYDYMDFKKWLKTQKYSLSTKNVYLFSVSSMYKVLKRYGVKNICDGVKAFSTNALTEYKKEGVDIKQWRKVLECIDTKTFNGTKHYLLIFMLFSTGVRQMSLRNLKWKHFEYRSKVGLVMKVQLKGAGIREDYILLNDECCKLLDNYQAFYQSHYCKAFVGEEINSDWYVFGLKDRQISESGIRKISRMHMKEAGIWKNGKVSPHCFRHGFAEIIVQKHGITEAQLMLCHKSINSTRIYAGQREKRNTLLKVKETLNVISSVDVVEPEIIIKADVIENESTFRFNLNDF